jgi:hypothetical protein
MLLILWITGWLAGAAAPIVGLVSSSLPPLTFARKA